MRRRLSPDSRPAGRSLPVPARCYFGAAAPGAWAGLFIASGAPGGAAPAARLLRAAAPRPGPAARSPERRQERAQLGSLLQRRVGAPAPPSPGQGGRRQALQVPALGRGSPGLGQVDPPGPRSAASDGGEHHTQSVLLLRSPTPRTNCSRRPPMAPEGLGGTAFRPMVRL